MSGRMPTAEEARLLAAMEALIDSGEPYGGRTDVERHIMRALENEGLALYYDGWWITREGEAALARYRAEKGDGADA